MFSAEFNTRDPNVKEIIHKQKHLFKTDDTLQQLFPRNHIFIVNKKKKEFARTPH